MKKQDQKQTQNEEVEQPAVDESTEAPEQPEYKATVSITHLDSGLVWKLGELTAQAVENVCSMVDVNSQTGNATRFQVKTGEIVVAPGSVIANCVVSVERTQ